MNARELIKHMRATGEDSGCEEAFAHLDQYVEAELDGRDVDALLPAIAEHLRNCAACGEDHVALLELVREELRA